MGRNTNTFSKDFKAAKADKTIKKPKDIDYTSKMGYQDGSPFSNRPFMDINTPNGYIDMSNTGRPILANGQYLPPYSGMHYMGTPTVREIPMAQNGQSVNDKFIDNVKQDASIWAGINMAELSKYAPRKVFFNSVKPLLPVARFLTGPAGVFLTGMDLMGTFDTPPGIDYHRDPLLNIKDNTYTPYPETLNRWTTDLPQQKNGGWLDEYQTGGNKNIYLQPLKAPVLPKIPTSQREADAMIQSGQLKVKDWRQIKQEEEAQRQREIQERRNRIAKSEAAKSKPFSAKQLADETGAIGDKLRVSEQPNFFDDYINPFSMIGDMASGLGKIPLNLQQGNYGQAALSVAAPLATGALAGIGANSTGQFVNNLVNPLAGTGQIIDNIGNKYLPNAYKYNPFAFKPNPNAYYRGIGEAGMDDALTTGVLRPNRTGTGLTNNTVYDAVFFDKGKTRLADALGRGNIAEVRDISMKEFSPNHMGVAAFDENTGKFLSEIPLGDNTKLLKRDWLRGYKEVPKPKTNFKSEIDWSKFNPDTPKYPELINEYDAIEESTKKAGTWMKNADGTPFQGTPEQFIQEQSSWYKKAFPEGHSNVYRGVSQTNAFADFNKSGDLHLKGDRGIFTANKDLANSYIFGNKRILNPFIPDNEPGLYDLIYPKGKQIVYNVNNSHWTDVDLVKMSSKINIKAQINSLKNFLKRQIEAGADPLVIDNQQKIINRLQNYYDDFDKIPNDPMAFRKMRENLGDITTTDAIAEYIPDSDLSSVTLQNINDGGFGDVTIVNNRPGNYLKSRVGNVGFFDMTSPNIYKSVAPFIGIGGAGALGYEYMQPEQKYGGVNPLMKARSKRDSTNKNIQSSINKLLLRNPDLFGPGGKNIYDPSNNKTMSNNKKYGGDSGAPYNGQPTAKEFFQQTWIPPGPVGFYKLGGQSTDEIAFPQQVPANYFFAGVPWENDLGHFAYGGGLPGGANNMPCFECGGYMEMGGIAQQYGGVNDGTMDTFKEGGNWIQKATASIKRRGTEGVCTGDKFGGPGCPPGSKRYNLAKTFRAMAKKAYGGNTDGVDQDDYISSRANDFNNAVRMNYGMAEADNQMKRLDQEQEALAQQAAMYGMPTAQYGINYNPQAISNYNQGQGMLDQWDQQGFNAYNQFFNSLNQGADTAYNKNQYIKSTLKKSKDPDYGAIAKAVQNAYMPKAQLGYNTYGEKRSGFEGPLSPEYVDELTAKQIGIPQQVVSQDRNYLDAYRSGYYPNYYRGYYPGYGYNPDYWMSQNGQTRYDYGNPNMWRNVYQNPQGGGSWNTPGWNTPNPFYNQMFGNPNMYTTLGDIDVKRGFLGSMKNPKRVKMHFNTYFNPTTGTMESVPAASSTSASSTAATDSKSKLSSMEQKALNQVNSEIANINAKIANKENAKTKAEQDALAQYELDKQKALLKDVAFAPSNDLSDLTNEQVSQLRGSVTPTNYNGALLQQLEDDAYPSMQSKTSSQYSPFNSLSQDLNNARTYFGNQAALNTGVTNIPNMIKGLPSVTQSQFTSDDYRNPLVRQEQQRREQQVLNYLGNQIGQNTGVFNIPQTMTPGVMSSQEKADVYRKKIMDDAAKASKARELNINSTAPAAPKSYPPGVTTDRQKWLFDTYGADRFFGNAVGMAYGGYLPMAQNGVNQTDPNAIPAMSPMKPRTINLPSQQPQAIPALQASPMNPVGGWDLTQERKNPWSGQDIYGVSMGVLGIGRNLASQDEKRAMEDYMAEQQLADNLFAAAGPYRGDITQTGSGYGSQFGSLNQTPSGAYTKSGGYVYANGGAFQTGVPIDLTDEQIADLEAQGYTVRPA